MPAMPAGGPLFPMGLALGTIDVLIIGACLLGMVLGFWSGFVWQIVRIVSVVASLTLAWVFHGDVARLLGSRFSEPARSIGGAVLIFVVSLVAFYILSFLFRRVLNALKLEMPDRILGALFGLAKVVLLVGGLAFAVLRYAEPRSALRRQVENSPSATVTARCVGAVLELLPRRRVDGADR